MGDRREFLINHHKAAARTNRMYFRIIVDTYSIPALFARSVFQSPALCHCGLIVADRFAIRVLDRGAIPDTYFPPVARLHP